MNRYYFTVCVVRVLENGVRQSCQFTMTQIADTEVLAKAAIRLEVIEQYFDWEHWIWPIDFLTWAAIQEREKQWALKLIRMKTVEVFV